MQDFGTKADNSPPPGGQLSAAEFNNLATENENAVLRSGQALSGASDTQLAQSLFLHSVKSAAFQDSGAANAYVATPVSGVSGVLLPDVYTNLNGAVISFKAANTNSGASTLNFGQTTGTLLGTKAIRTQTDVALPAGAIAAGQYLELVYNSSFDSGNGAWVLLPWAFAPSNQSFRNIIQNGMFNINQRGYVSGTATTGANQLTLDRWKVRTSGQSLTFSVSGIGFSIVAPAGGLEQVVESVNVLGGTYVASWTGAGTLTVNAVSIANGGTFTLPANTNATFVLVGAFEKFQVELGTVPTATEVKPRAVELSLCQRYAFVVGSGSAQVIGWGRMATTTAVFSITVYTPVPLRATPTITDIGTGSAIQIVSTTTSAANAPSAVLAQSNIVTFDSGSASANTAGAIAGYFIGATSKVLFSSDI